MALDKSRTKPWVKVVIILFCVALVFGVGTLSIEGFISMFQGNGAQSPNATTASQSTTDTLNAIAAKYQPVITAQETSLAADPNSYDLNKYQGQNYFDWAAEVQQTLSQTPANSSQQTQMAAQQLAISKAQPIWGSAVPFFAKALKIRPGDPNTTTDYAIATFYSGDINGAIKIGSDLASKATTFSPVLFNLGIFYETNNDTASAKASFTKYLQIDPNGPSAAQAKSILANIK
jgi:Flp pilus assembly protein TadD